MKRLLVLSLLSVLLWSGCKHTASDFEAILPSPAFDIHLYFNLFNGHPYYMVYHYDQKVFEWSALGFLPDSGVSLNSQLELVERVRTDQKRAAQEEADNGYFAHKKFNSLSVRLQSVLQPQQAYTIEFRTFKGGAAYRYHFPNADLKKEVEQFERSEFVLDTNTLAWKAFPRQDSTEHEQVTFPLPFDLHANGYRLSILSDDTTAHGLRLKTSLTEPFRLVSQPGNNQNTERSANPLKTAWRIILISKDGANE